MSADLLKPANNTLRPPMPKSKQKSLFIQSIDLHAAMRELYDRSPVARSLWQEECPESDPAHNAPERDGAR